MFYNYALLFLFGSILGYFVESFYLFINGFNYLNHGFLFGPWLPIFGFGVLIYYLISKSKIKTQYKFLLFALGPTVLEFIVGLFFKYVYKVSLWNYSKEDFNLLGIISPKYVFYWFVLGLIFYYLFYPNLNKISKKIKNYKYLKIITIILYVIFGIDIILSFISFF